MIENRSIIGAWRSLEARLLWEQEVGGSNPLAPTSKILSIKKLSLITLYVLKGKTGKRYVGITNNLSRRLQEYRSRKTKGSQLLDELEIESEPARGG